MHHRLGWGIFGALGIAGAIALGGGCASSNSDGGTGGSGGTGTTASSTMAATTGATTGATTSAATTSATTSSATTSTTTSTTTASTTASTGTGMVPAGWTCDPVYYGDTDCDCGCGAPDVDCANALVASCVYCSDTGSCSPGDCPGSIDPMDNSKCVMNQPENTAALCADGVDNDFDTFIDCMDPDCAAIPACVPPMGWTCPATSYFDTICDCGCGVPDPHCMDATNASCGACDTMGSCSATYNLACPSAINATNNAICDAPVPENTDALCGDMIDNDFDGDTDCADTDCKGHGACAPLAWTCNPSYYSDSDCDCGCGVLDPACADATVASCTYCADIGSCSATSCPGTINPTNNAVCN